jgi:hypothetical protein
MTGKRCWKRILSPLFGLSIALATIKTASAAEISRNRDLPPLKLLAGDLDTILQRAHSLIDDANGPSSQQDSSRESVTVGIRGREIEIPHFSVASSVGFPNVVFRFAYNYDRPGKPISSVQLDLKDDSRRLSVSGQAADQIEAISNAFESGLLRHSALIGGAMFRRIAGVCVSLLFLASLIAGSVYWWRARDLNALWMPICSAVGLVLVFRLPWDSYLPGFALYQSYSRFFLIRHAPQVALLALAATIVGIPLSYFLSRNQR